MINLKTLSTYLFKLYCRYFINTSLILSGIFTLSNIFDCLQRFKNANLASHLFWKLALYKVPYLTNEVAPLISFISMLFLLRRLTIYNELTIILGHGIQFWRVLIFPIIATLFLGGVITTIINPIGTYGLQRYDNLAAKLTKRKQDNFSITPAGISFFEEYKDSNRIIHAKSIHLDSKELKDIIILFIDSNNQFLKRFDAKKGIVSDGNFQLFDLKVLSTNGLEQYESFNIPTNLSITSFTSHFTSPEMISIWNLSTSINKLAKSGLPVINYQIYYYKQILKPLTMIATVVMASCFVSLRQTDSSQKRMLLYALLIGFAVYSALEIILKILAYSGLSPILATSIPIALIILISGFIVLHLYEV